MPFPWLGAGLGGSDADVLKEEHGTFLDGSCDDVSTIATMTSSSRISNNDNMGWEMASVEHDLLQQDLIFTERQMATIAEKVAKIGRLNGEVDASLDQDNEWSDAPDGETVSSPMSAKSRPLTDGTVPKLRRCMTAPMPQLSMPGQTGSLKMRAESMTRSSSCQFGTSTAQTTRVTPRRVVADIKCAANSRLLDDVRNMAHKLNESRGVPAVKPQTKCSQTQPQPPPVSHSSASRGYPRQSGAQRAENPPAVRQSEKPIVLSAGGIRRSGSGSLRAGSAKSSGVRVMPSIAETPESVVEAPPPPQEISTRRRPVLGTSSRDAAPRDAPPNPSSRMRGGYWRPKPSVPSSSPRPGSINSSPAEPSNYAPVASPSQRPRSDVVAAAVKAKTKELVFEMTATAPANFLSKKLQEMTEGPLQEAGRPVSLSPRRGTAAFKSSTPRSGVELQKMPRDWM